jgi:hypothetical protein
MLGRPAETDLYVREAAELTVSDRLRAQLAVCLVECRFFGGRDLPGALSAFADARLRLREAAAIAILDARRAVLLANAGRPGDALRAIDALPRDLEPHVRVDVTAARAVSLISIGRCDEAAVLSRAAATDQADLPGWLARRGMARHLLNEAHALAYAGSLRRSPRPAGTGRPARARGRGDRRVGVVRDGARRDRTRHGPGRRGGSALPGGRRSRAGGRAGGRTRLGSRWCRPRSPAGGPLRRGCRRAGPSRRPRRQPRRHVGVDPGASHCSPPTAWQVGTSVGACISRPAPWTPIWPGRTASSASAVATSWRGRCTTCRSRWHVRNRRTFACREVA